MRYNINTKIIITDFHIKVNRSAKNIFDGRFYADIKKDNDKKSEIRICYS